MRDFTFGHFGIFDTQIARPNAAADPGFALADGGPVPSALFGVTGTDIAGDTATTAVLTVGAPATVSTIDTIGDLDFFKVQLVAGQTYEIGMFARLGGPSLLPLQDAYVELYDAAGTIITAADGGASTTINTANSGLDAILTYTATRTGTYFVNARAFDNVPADGTNGDLIGDYDVSVANITGQSVYVPYYTPSSPLYSLDWGTQVDGTTRNPDGAETGHLTGNPFATPDDKGTGIIGKNVISIYFAKLGDLFVSEDPTQPSLPPATVAVGAKDFELTAVWTALREFEKVADVVYVETQVRAEADFEYFTYTGTPGPGVSLLGSMSPPQENDEGLALFNSGDNRWNALNLAQGGFSFVTLIHEFGHGHGMAHPHDNGGHSGIMNGVEAEGAGIADYTTGDFALNQAVHTMMSYEDGWPESPHGNAATDAGYGYLGGLMAFDIATIQDKYGVNEDWARGNDTYTLKDVNAAGTFYTSIWDAAGTDQIVYDGARDSLIDLRAATLQYEFGGGGRVSYADGIFGGFTIANGAVIENARTGSGNDKLVGNAAANTLAGNAGNDLLRGALGNDRLEGGAGNDWLEGGAGADTLIGGKGGSDVFLIARDNAGSSDAIVDFGTGDMLVTNVKIVDSNRDNIINPNKNKVYDLGGGSSVGITGETGKAVSALYYNGAYSEGGVDYFVYSTTKNAGVAGFAGKLDDYDFG